MSCLNKCPRRKTSNYNPCCYQSPPNLVCMKSRHWGCQIPDLLVSVLMCVCASGSLQGHECLRIGRSCNYQHVW